MEDSERESADASSSDASSSNASSSRSSSRSSSSNIRRNVETSVRHRRTSHSRAGSAEEEDSPTASDDDDFLDNDKVSTPATASSLLENMSCYLAGGATQLKNPALCVGLACVRACAWGD